MEKDEYIPEDEGKPEEDAFPSGEEDDAFDFSGEFDFAEESRSGEDPDNSSGGYEEEPDTGDEYEGNPADNDGLDAYEEDTDSGEESGREEDDNPDPPDGNEEAAVSVKKPVTREKNKAPFLDKFKILLIIFAILIVLILASVFFVPGNEKKAEEDILDKKGSIYIPENIKKWQPDKLVTESSPFSGNVPSDGTGQSTTPTDEEIEGLLGSIPYSDEAQQQNTAPVPVPSNTTGTAAAAAPARPITNANEQQKQIPRMPLNDGTDYQTPGMGNAAYTAPGVTDYAAYAQTRMNDLMAQMQGYYGSTNTYQSQNMQDNKQQFFNQNSGNTNMKWNNEYSLFYGTIIPAVLITGINTDLPGVVIAQVTSNVYSSQTGEYLLIPAGTKIYATYNSSVSYGQDRVQVAWNKMIRPDGLEIDLGNFVGVDKSGYAGYDGRVNTHPFETLKALGLIAAFSIFDTKTGNMQAAQNNMYAQNVLADTYSEINKLGGKIIDRALDIQPTITIPQGKEVKIITNVTMTLPPFEQKQVYEKYVRQ